MCIFYRYEIGQYCIEGLRRYEVRNLVLFWSWKTFNGLLKFLIHWLLDAKTVEDGCHKNYYQVDVSSRYNKI